MLRLSTCSFNLRLNDAQLRAYTVRRLKLNWSDGFRRLKPEKAKPDRLF